MLTSTILLAISWPSLPAVPQMASLVGRTDVVIERLVEQGRLPKGSRCSASLRDIPICLVLEADAKPKAILADLLGCRVAARRTYPEPQRGVGGEAGDGSSQAARALGDGGRRPLAGRAR